MEMHVAFLRYMLVKDLNNESYSFHLKMMY